MSVDNSRPNRHPQPGRKRHDGAVTSEAANEVGGSASGRVLTAGSPVRLAPVRGARPVTAVPHLPGGVAVLAEHPDPRLRDVRVRRAGRAPADRPRLGPRRTPARHVPWARHPPCGDGGVPRRAGCGMAPARPAVAGDRDGDGHGRRQRLAGRAPATRVSAPGKRRDRGGTARRAGPRRTRCQRAGGLWPGPVASRVLAAGGRQRGCSRWHHLLARSGPSSGGLASVPTSRRSACRPRLGLGSSPPFRR